MPGRDFKFYTELVLVTVLSLVAANAWIRVLKQILNHYYPNSITVDVITAIVMTGIAIGILHMIFSKKESPYQEKEVPDIIHHTYRKIYMHENE